MTAASEIRASEQMRDRIADLLHHEGVSRDHRSPSQIERGRPLPPRAALLLAMARRVRGIAPRRAAREVGDV